WVMRWVACSRSARVWESDTICQGQTGQDRTVEAGARRPIRSRACIISPMGGCTEPARGRIPSGLTSCAGRGYFFLVFLSSFLGVLRDLSSTFLPLTTVFLNVFVPP